MDWKTAPRVARPYACKSCGTRYPAALHPEIDGPRALYIEWRDEQGRRCSSLDRFNAYVWCRTVGCSRFYHYGAKRRRSLTAHIFGFDNITHPARAPRLQMRKLWLPMPPPANGSTYPKETR